MTEEESLNIVHYWSHSPPNRHAMHCLDRYNHSKWCMGSQILQPSLDYDSFQSCSPLMFLFAICLYCPDEA